ncbi:hypothetical protein IscW_ISCW007802 [Ixodes scapularis]|uniref:Secreted protein n=1 Tax=Ixodes scapularis TaxID=6945 RepID=B7PRQ8_IXOSC|nr:hypothetical protein IscW_ISCW007802 [Ixodes scapularis]|eukprot:XP_002400819.1 hypothetical protein IscW_ISCW007802 [Ixodes scapularis]
MALPWSVLIIGAHLRPRAAIGFCYCTCGATSTSIAGDEEVLSHRDSLGDRPRTRSMDGGRGKNCVFFVVLVS